MTARRYAHMGGRKVHPHKLRNALDGSVVPVPGSTGPTGDRTPDAVGEEQHRRFVPPWLLPSFRCQHHPTYVAPTLSFVCNGNSMLILPPYMDCLLGGTAGEDACTFESFRGSGCFLCHDCFLSFQHDPVFNTWPIILVAAFVAAGS
jgi:hypothetical protein